MVQLLLVLLFVVCSHVKYVPLATSCQEQQVYSAKIKERDLCRLKINES